eukprot:1293295-Rhodomonas_salina.1
MPVFLYIQNPRRVFLPLARQLLQNAQAGASGLEVWRGIDYSGVQHEQSLLGTTEDLEESGRSLPHAGAPFLRPPSTLAGSEQKHTSAIKRMPKSRRQNSARPSPRASLPGTPGALSVQHPRAAAIKREPGS